MTENIIFKGPVTDVRAIVSEKGVYFVLRDIIVSAGRTAGNMKYIAEKRRIPGIIKDRFPNLTSKKTFARKFQTGYLISPKGVLHYIMLTNTPAAYNWKEKHFLRMNAVAGTGQKILENKQQTGFIAAREDVFYERRNFNKTFQYADVSKGYTNGSVFKFTELVNVAVFGMESGQWRDENKEVLHFKALHRFEPNMRDAAKGNAKQVDAVNRCEKAIINAIRKGATEKQLEQGFKSWVKTQNINPASLV